MILRDDNFESIYDAVREGRIIFNNIRKFVLYLMSCNVSELLVILIAALLGFPLPLLPLQILFLNVVPISSRRSHSVPAAAAETSWIAPQRPRRTDYDAHSLGQTGTVQDPDSGGDSRHVRDRR